jgi:hypothetical protein
MKRVCKPGGKIVVADSSPAADRADAFNAMEKLRDPSHTRAMPLAELKSLFTRHGLPEPSHTWYRLTSDMESLLSRRSRIPAMMTRSARSFGRRSRMIFSIFRRAGGRADPLRLPCRDPRRSALTERSASCGGHAVA